MGDGAFCMNPGMLMVERQMNLPNLTHFLVSNRHYGATSNTPLPNQKLNDYEAIARGMGLERVFTFDSIEALERSFEAVLAPNVKGHTFVVLEVEPLTVPEQKSMQSPPFDGPDLKYRFGRQVERINGRNIFGYRKSRTLMMAASVRIQVAWPQNFPDAKSAPGGATAPRFARRMEKPMLPKFAVLGAAARHSAVSL